MALLEVQNLARDFGGLRAVDNVSLKVEKGEVLGLIGPNGAGKTTLFNVVSGEYRPTSGRVIFKGKDIGGLRPHSVAARGLVRTWQSSVLFQDETVMQNISIGLHLKATSSLWAQLLSTRKYAREEAAMMERVHGILEFMGLSSLKGELAKNLPHGHQRLLGVALALASEPDLLLLDEPVTGMNPNETLAMVALIKRMRSERGLTMIIVEHDMRVIMGLSDRVAVLSYGKKIAEGLPEEIKTNKEVIEAYLGKEEIS